MKRTNDYKNTEINTEINNKSNIMTKKYYYLLGAIILVVGGVCIYYFLYDFEDIASNFIIRTIMETEVFNS